MESGSPSSFRSRPTLTGTPSPTVRFEARKARLRLPLLLPTCAALRRVWALHPLGPPELLAAGGFLDRQSAIGAQPQRVPKQRTWRYGAPCTRSARARDCARAERLGTP